MVWWRWCDSATARARRSIRDTPRWCDSSMVMMRSDDDNGTISMKRCHHTIALSGDELMERWRDGMMTMARCFDSAMVMVRWRIGAMPLWCDGAMAMMILNIYHMAPRVIYQNICPHRDTSASVGITSQGFRVTEGQIFWYSRLRKHEIYTMWHIKIKTSTHMEHTTRRSIPLSLIPWPCYAPQGPGGLQLILGKCCASINQSEHRKFVIHLALLL